MTLHRRPGSGEGVIRWLTAGSPAAITAPASPRKPITLVAVHHPPGSHLARRPGITCRPVSPRWKHPGPHDRARCGQHQRQVAATVLAPRPGYMGIPFTGPAAIGAAAVLASQGQLNIVAVLTVAAKGNELGLLGFQVGE
jgi:hypothetical protein